MHTQELDEALAWLQKRGIWLAEEALGRMQTKVAQAQRRTFKKGKNILAYAAHELDKLGLVSHWTELQPKSSLGMRVIHALALAELLQQLPPQNKLYTTWEQNFEALSSSVAVTEETIQKQWERLKQAKGAMVCIRAKRADLQESWGHQFKDAAIQKLLSAGVVFLPYISAITLLQGVLPPYHGPVFFGWSVDNRPFWYIPHASSEECYCIGYVLQ